MNFPGWAVFRLVVAALGYGLFMGWAIATIYITS